MKQETNNEMDLLLRRLGRRHDTRVSGAADHLDADELNAYAANALPQSARTRYAEHLADCPRCRELVVQLSTAAGVVSAAESRTVAESSVLRKFLANLFSPLVLRYAVPATGILFVALIGLVVMQRDRQSKPDAVALQTEQTKPSLPQATEPAAGEINENYVTQDRNSTQKADATQQLKQKEEIKAPAPAPSATVDAEQNAPAKLVEQQRVTTAAEAPNQPVAKPVTTTDDIRQPAEDTGRKQEVAVSVAPNEVSKKNIEMEGAERSQVAQTPARSRREESKVPAAAAVGGVQGAGVRGAVDSEGRRDKDEGETRSVAGRRFRKERGIWIDTAYDRSRDTISLTRGSESYRSLVADEPQIKAIADQLDGEIIVVWKGRTYRIR